MKDDQTSQYQERRLKDVRKLIADGVVSIAPFEDKTSDRSYLYVPREMLVFGDKKEQAHATTPWLLQWGCRPSKKTANDAAKRLNVSCWECPADASVPELVDRLRAAVKGRNVEVGPNHIFASEPRWAWGGGGAPTPAASYTEPTTKASSAKAYIGVVDTGVASDIQENHVALYKHLTTVIDEDVDKLDVDLDGLLDTGAGHGTFVLGILNRIAPNRRLEMQKVLTSDGFGDELTIALGLSQLDLIDPLITSTNRKGGIVNLSFGGYTHDDQPPAGLRAALDLLGTTVVMVSAAGNHSTPDAPFWPAAFPDVVAVAAVDTRDQSNVVPAPFTNTGSWVDVCAPGVDIHSTYVTGKWEDTDGFDGYARWTGTSFAAPQVAAAIAVWAKTHNVTATIARDQFLATLAPQGTAGMGLLYAPTDPALDLVYRGV